MYLVGLCFYYSLFNWYCIVGISKLGVITCMAKRSKVNKNKSKKLFTKTADRTKGLNLRAVPMRGGFRI